MERPMFFGAYPEIFAAARRLREKMTIAESMLWDQLKNRKLGVRFKPQHPVMHYVADFYFHAAKLVVEVDGPIHLYQTEKDKERTHEIEGAGIKIIRFTNEQVVCKMDFVLQEIRNAIESRMRDSL
jgi:cyclase